MICFWLRLLSVFFLQFKQASMLYFVRVRDLTKL